MKEKENITIMEDAKEYDKSINFALNIISETLNTHTNRINILLELVERQNKIIEKITERMKIIETNNNNNNRIYG
jgi:hypothetical protein